MPSAQPVAPSPPRPLSFGRRIVVLRHGRTAHNAGGLIQGQLDIDLDDTGRAQAKAAAQVLAAIPPAVLVSSDLIRASETAQPLGDLAGVAPVLDPRLRELFLGTWQGLTGEQVQRSHPDEYAAWRAGRDLARGGGETYRDAGDRAAACVRELLPSVRPGGTLIAVTHGGTARAALGVLLGLPDQTWGSLSALGNCCWSVLVEADRGWRLERHNTGLGALLGPVGVDPGQSSARPGAAA